MVVAIMDMETNGLIDRVTKMHCFCVSVYNGNKFLFKRTVKTGSELSLLFLELKAMDAIIVGHNIIRFDFPVIKKLFNLDYTGTKWDTLAMSYKLFPDRAEHGLEYYGNRYKVLKPVVEDWKLDTIEKYVHRCEVDVEINTLVFSDLYSYFVDIYYPQSPNKDINYATWKMDCAREQEENPIKVDRNLVNISLAKVTKDLELRYKQLRLVMPKDIKYKTVKYPNKFLKKDGEISVAGEKWLDILRENNLPKTHKEPIEVVDNIKEPNPGSTQQLKNWLFNLGWEPTIYKTRVSKITGIAKEVPQIQDDDKELCSDLQTLIPDNPELEHLEGMFMVKHRQGVFQAFLDKMTDDDFLIASVAGFTNTMRFKHRKPIANMPGVKKPYGKQIRGSLIARNENYLFCGSDMSSLEDSTKQHYMYFYDPTYVEEMRVPGFDPHTDIAVFASLMTKEEEITFKHLKDKADKKEILSNDEKEILSYLSGVRSDAKVVNFSGIYGAGPAKLMKVLKCTLEFATDLHKAYWERNKAVKKISKDAQYKLVRKQLWLWNPVAKMWYYLKNLKDIFSTLNQGKPCPE